MSNLCGNCFRESLNDRGVCTACGFHGWENREKYPLALPPGAILNGRYIIGKVLGQGGFGITYTARDYQTGEIVAIKEFFPDSMVTRSNHTAVMPFTGERGENFGYGKDTFLMEAKTMAEFIGCPNIVRVYSYFEENGTGYFVMEYVDGQSFQTYLRERYGRIPWEDAQRIILPVMDALSLVHEKGIIHRDIAPDNICIAKDGTVKLLDFGAARYSLGNVSQSLDVVLRHGFAPREQYKRRGRQGPYTDVYALGATLYYALTGVRPDDALERWDEDNMPLPSSLGANVTVAQENVILKAMAVNPEDRYQTMAEFRQDLLYAVDAGNREREEAFRQAQARKEAEEQERLRLEKEAEKRRQEEERQRRLAEEKAERERKQKEERERLAAEKAEKEKKLREERQRRAREKKEARQVFWNKNKKKIAVAGFAVILTVAVVQGRQIALYHNAVELKENGTYQEAIPIFVKLGDYRDAGDCVLECQYLQGKALLDAGDPQEALGYFMLAAEYGDARQMVSECDYRIAVNYLEAGDYEKAYGIFDSIRDYKDSAELCHECDYRKGRDLYEAGDYASAQEALMVLGEYKDAQTLLNSSRYELGKAFFEDGRYAEAYDAWLLINDSELDFSDMKRDCVWHLAKNAHDEARIEDALYWVMELEAMGGAPKGKDASFLQTAKLNYTQKLIDTGKDSKLREAISLLETMGSGKNVKDQIKAAEYQLKQNEYDAAAALLQAGKYEDAVDAFAELKDFSDGKQQWLEAMYQYVQANKKYYATENSGNSLSDKLYKMIGSGENKKTFYTYAETLSKNKYQDSQAYYKELTAWYVTITMNNKTDNDEKTAMDTISKYDNMCAHITLRGGPLNGKTTLKYVFILPSGSKVSGKFDGDWEEDWYGTCWCYYNTPSQAPGGTCTVKIYDAAGNLLGTNSIRVTG